MCKGIRVILEEFAKTSRFYASKCLCNLNKPMFAASKGQDHRGAE
jgi:hypothetical protein